MLVTGAAGTLHECKGHHIYFKWPYQVDFPVKYKAVLESAYDSFFY